MRFQKQISIFTQCVLYASALSCAPVWAGTVVVNSRANAQGNLQQARRYCKGAAYPDSVGGIAPSVPYLSQVGFNQIRGLNVDNTNASVPGDQNKLDANGNFVPGARLNEVLRESRRYRYNPMIVVGQQTPYYLLQSYGNAWTWSDSVWQQYRNYAYKFARYAALEYQGSGFNRIVFEVGNETELVPPEYVWSEPGIKPDEFGTPQRYAHLRRIYGIWQEAVNRVAQESPTRKILITGPSITPYGMFYAPRDRGINWVDTFIDDVAKNNWRLDYFSYHFYGDQGKVGNAPPHRDFSSMGEQFQSINQKLKARGLRAKVILTEWGPSSTTDQNSILGQVNYTHEGAAWAIAFMHENLKSSVLNDAIVLTIRDNVGTAATGNPALPSLLHIRNGATYPKPLYGACRMMYLLPGNRKAVTIPNTQPNLIAIAGGHTSKRSTGVIVANYRYNMEVWNNTASDLAQPEPVTIQFDGLPFSGPGVVRQYLIDANTNNSAVTLKLGRYRYLKKGSQKNPKVQPRQKNPRTASKGRQFPLIERAQINQGGSRNAVLNDKSRAKKVSQSKTGRKNASRLQLTNEFEVNVQNGTVMLPEVTLGKSAVSLWTIEPRK
jgi:xylan 1,4-beta-xylosidase